MTWRRLINRNGLYGDYDNSGLDPTKHPGELFDSCMKMIMGDMRRLVHDALGNGFWPKQLAEKAGVDKEQCINTKLKPEANEAQWSCF